MTSEDNVIDPVCGMTLSRLQAPFSREHGGTIYHLCSVECMGKFDKDGEAYAATARLKLPGWGETPHPESVIEQFRRPS